METRLSYSTVQSLGIVNSEIACNLSKHVVCRDSQTNNTTGQHNTMYLKKQALIFSQKFHFPDLDSTLINTNVNITMLFCSQRN